MLPMGHFCLEEVPQFDETNIELRIGIFEKTLPTFAEYIGDKKIRFAHIDCDLYSSTCSIFNLLGAILPPEAS